MNFNWLFCKDLMLMPRDILHLGHEAMIVSPRLLGRALEVVVVQGSPGVMSTGCLRPSLYKARWLPLSTEHMRPQLYKLLAATCGEGLRPYL